MKNHIIIGEREIGKTYYLFNEVSKLVTNGEQLVILDSATEHREKSLLHKVANTYEKSQIVNIDDQDKIVLNRIGYNIFKNNYKYFFPFNEIINCSKKILCFDLSYFLEKGHDEYDKTSNINIYKYYRNLYNYLAEQIVYSLILSSNDGYIDCSHVIMDEIEFPITNTNISTLESNIEFLAAVHPENAFGTFYNSFEPIQYKKYVKRGE